MTAVQDSSFGKEFALPPITPSDSIPKPGSLGAGGMTGGAGGGGGGSDNPGAAGASGVLGEDFSYSSKLTNVEAQRIMAVLQELQRKVYLIGLLPDVMDRRVSTVFGGETFNIIKDYRLLEQRYKGQLETKDPSESHQAEVKDLAKQIRVSTRSLTRHFIQNSGALAKLRYLKSTKSPVVAQFEHLLQEIKILVYGRLKTTVEEEKAKQDQLAIIIAKEQKASNSDSLSSCHVVVVVFTSNEVKSLKEELEKAKKERMGEINKRNEVIRRLKDELREIKHQAEEATKKLESRSKQKEEADVQNFQEKQSDKSPKQEDTLRKEIDSLTKQLETDTASNREEEALLRKKKFKIESEVENWIHKYDQDMDEKQAEIDDISAIFMEEKSHLDELQSRYADLQKEYEKILEDKRIAEEEKKASRRSLL
eukprot:jgi/Hompol1/6728/HPOL_005057-RA